MTQLDLRSDETKYLDDQIARAVARERLRCANICERHIHMRLALADELEKKKNPNGALLDRIRASQAEVIANEIRADPQSERTP